MTSKKTLSLFELIAIAIGGMVGGGIFSILGVSVELVGDATPVAIAIGGILAFFAAYSYVKLSGLYQDEGATYSFFKKTFPKSGFAASAIGWLITFGYISTLGLYAYTFASYLSGLFPGIDSEWGKKLIAGGIIVFFMLINIISVKGMGRIEDFLVYTKIIILLIISYLFLSKGDLQHFSHAADSDFSIGKILIVASITFVAYEGFQLVINAFNEMRNPLKNIPRSIYISIGIVIFLYVLLAIATISVIPKADLIRDKEFALAAGANQFIGKSGLFLVVFGALMATSSAISGTLFGASRLMAVIASDHYLPKALTKRKKGVIPYNALITMTILAILLIFSGELQLLLEFGSITFILVSFLMAVANYKMRKETNTQAVIALIALIGLFAAGVTILAYEFTHNIKQLGYILSVYACVIGMAYLYSKRTEMK